MNSDNKYAWSFRQTVGWGYAGEPIYQRYLFGSLYELVRTIVYFRVKMFQRAYRRGWSKRWEVS